MRETLTTDRVDRCWRFSSLNCYSSIPINCNNVNLRCGILHFLKSLCMYEVVLTNYKFYHNKNIKNNKTHRNQNTRVLTARYFIWRSFLLIHSKFVFAQSVIHLIIFGVWCFVVQINLKIGTSFWQKITQFAETALHNFVDYLICERSSHSHQHPPTCAPIHIYTKHDCVHRMYTNITSWIQFALSHSHARSAQTEFY